MGGLDSLTQPGVHTDVNQIRSERTLLAQLGKCGLDSESLEMLASLRGDHGATDARKPFSQNWGNRGTESESNPAT